MSSRARLFWSDSLTSKIRRTWDFWMDVLESAWNALVKLWTARSTWSFSLAMYAFDTWNEPFVDGPNNREVESSPGLLQGFQHWSLLHNKESAREESLHICWGPRTWRVGGRCYSMPFARVRTTHTHDDRPRMWLLAQIKTTYVGNLNDALNRSTQEWKGNEDIKMESANSLESKNLLN